MVLVVLNALEKVLKCQISDNRVLSKSYATTLSVYVNCYFVKRKQYLVYLYISKIAKMLQDVNSESSFEMINKKHLETGNYYKYVDSKIIHSVSESLGTNLPALMANQSRNINPPTGNLLSNVQPPSTMPDFTLWSSPSSVEDGKINISTPVSTQAISSMPSTSLPVSLPNNLVQTNLPVSPVTQEPKSVSTSQDAQPLLVGNQFPQTEFRYSI